VAPKPAASAAPVTGASLKAAASEGALRNLTMEGELDELMLNDATPQRTASCASLAPSEEADDASEGDDSDDAEVSPWPAASGRAHARVALTSPRSAPIAVHRPAAAGSLPALRSSFNTFNWRARVPDAAADALSGGAFMPPQWIGDAVDGDSEDNSSSGGGASLLSSSLPPLRALALRDCILRRTGFIESEASPPASAPSRG
jgi:hypothetical protein